MGQFPQKRKRHTAEERRQKRAENLENPPDPKLVQRYYRAITGKPLSAAPGDKDS